MIKFFNTFIAIENYSKNSKLEESLTVRDKVTHQVEWVAYDYQPKKNILIIPKGYSSKYLQELFPDKEVYYVERDENVSSISIKADKYPPKNDIQIRALEWLHENSRFNKKLMDVTMDSGKTYIALKYICDCKKIALIIVHNDGILNQWIKEILKFTNIERNEIGIIKGSKSIDECENNLQYKIFIASELTLRNIIDNNKTRLFKFCKNVGIGIKVVDEAHLFLKTICEIDLHTNVIDNIYLTGTAERTNWKENKILSRILPLNYSFNTMNSDYANTERRITTILVDYDSRTTTLASSELYNRYGFQLAKWATLTINFIDLLINIFKDYYDYIENMLKDRNLDLQHAIFLKTLEQCRLFEDQLKFMLPGITIGMFNSLNEKNKKDALNAKVIITTEKSFGVAIDSKINVIHNFIPISSKASIMQMAGRLRKNEVSIFLDYTDESIEGCVKSKAIKKAIFKKIALKLYERIYNPERLRMQYQGKL